MEVLFRPSIDDVLKKNGGVGPGFDLVRIGLAALIFYGHCFWVAGGLTNNQPVFGAAGGAHHSTPLIWQGQSSFRQLLVPMFFAVSGFLVTGSAFRTRSLKTFLTFRILRIVPALGTEVCLSALVLGPLLTVVPLREYFADSKFWQYFENIVGRVHMLLPGMFLRSPATRSVNVNLWTLPAEFYCYLIIGASLVSGLLVRRTTFTVIFVAATAFLIGLERFIPVEQSGDGPLSNVLIVYYFFCGCFLFQWKHLIPYSRTVFVMALATSYFLTREGSLYLAPLLASYVIIFVGMTKLPRVEFIQRGDYSYGVYLYGFPIAQALIASIPALRGHGWILLAAGGTITFGFAVLSWHFIEKPALSLKRFVKQKRLHPVEVLVPRLDQVHH
jgi:peptidoglycan/LPS O-acetylase OafA/YrhL